MTRAALLPTPGDPFLLKLWFKYYERWADEVDRLYIYVNSNSEKYIIDYIKKTAEQYPNVFFIHIGKQIEHGEALKQMLQMATEDLIMFVEDDGFIFKAGYIDKCFKLIESGEVDAVGSRRGSCSQWLYEKASEIYAVDNSGLGDNGPNFWPNFFFAKRSDLSKVGNFAAKHWDEGELVRQVNMKAPEETVGDTFVEGSLDLRAMGLRFAYVPQFHGNTDDMTDYMNQTGIWGPEAGWLHVGSLSSGFHGMLKPDHQLDREHFSTDNEKLELERRVVFYKLGLADADLDNGIPKIKEQYRSGIERLIQVYDLSPARIHKRMAMYREVMK